MELLSKRVLEENRIPLRLAWKHVMTREEISAEVAQLEAENERLRELEENLRDAWPVINGVLIIPPDGVLENHDVAGHILDVLFEALGGEKSNLARPLEKSEQGDMK